MANHVGTHSRDTFLPSSYYGPFDSPSDYHTYCEPGDWDDQEQIEDCVFHSASLAPISLFPLTGWLSDRMPDLNTESLHVVRTLHMWIRNLVETYHIDILRVDTVKHIRKSFWPDFVNSQSVSLGESSGPDEVDFRWRDRGNGRGASWR